MMPKQGILLDICKLLVVLGVGLCSRGTLTLVTTCQRPTVDIPFLNYDIVIDVILRP